MPDKTLDTRSPTRGEIADLLCACLMEHSCVVAPGSSMRWWASVERTDDGFSASVASREANQIDLDDDEAVLASVDVSLESDSIDWDDWNDAEDTENEDGARDFALSGHETYDNYVSLAWERYVEDSASLWAKEILDTHAARQWEDE
jgi:hypothetical protein